MGMGKEQKVLVAKQMRQQEVLAKRRAAEKRHRTEQLIIGILILTTIFVVFYMFSVIIHNRIERWPDLGNCSVPKGTWLYDKWTNTVWSTCK